MKKMMISFSLLLICTLPIAAFSITQSANKEDTSASTMAKDGMQQMSAMMNNMQNMRTHMMARKMMMMGAKMRMLGTEQSKPTNTEASARSKKLVALGEQLFAMGKEMGGDKPMQMPMMKQMSGKCMNMMQEE